MKCCKKVPGVSKLVINSSLNAKIVKVENKIPDVSKLVANSTLNTKIRKVGKKIPNHDLYISNSDFDMLTSETFTEKIKAINFSKQN